MARLQNDLTFNFILAIQLVIGTWFHSLYRKFLLPFLNSRADSFRLAWTVLTLYPVVEWVVRYRWTGPPPAPPSAWRSLLLPHQHPPHQHPPHQHKVTANTALPVQPGLGHNIQVGIAGARLGCTGGCGEGGVQVCVRAVDQLGQAGSWSALHTARLPNIAANGGY